jgi:hypothetical protein
MFANALLSGEMALISAKSLRNTLDEVPSDLPPASSPLLDIMLKYMDTTYTAMREHADDHAYQLADPKAVALWRTRRDSIRASNQYSHSVQSHARRIQDATVAAETKALASKKAGTRFKDDDDANAMAPVHKASQAERRRKEGQPGQAAEAPQGGTSRQDLGGSQGA